MFLLLEFVAVYLPPTHQAYQKQSLQLHCGKVPKMGVSHREYELAQQCCDLPILQSQE